MILADRSANSKFIMDGIHLSKEEIDLLQKELNYIICKKIEKK